MTQLQAARQGTLTPEMEHVLAAEPLSAAELQTGLAQGTIVIPANRNHKNLTPYGIGRGLRVKINANIGTSSDLQSLDEELEKLQVAIDNGAHAVMDLSTGGDINAVRREIMARCSVPLGTVPIYQAVTEGVRKRGFLGNITVDDFFAAVEGQAEEGVDFMTIHCGVTLRTLEALRRSGRITDVVSRGGAFLVEWMLYNNRENPFYENYDRLLAVAREYDVTLSLGDGLRPGCLADATDRPQVQELIYLGELTERAWEAGVQVMIEGPGHVPLDQIEANILLEKKLCKGAPFYVLGPLVTDIAPGYDHLVGAIGGAIAARAGADFLCYLTPAEHLKLPDAQDVKEGVIASRIAAHAADIARGLPGAMEWDNQMAIKRKQLDWEGQIALAIDPEKARRFRESAPPADQQVCTMCGEFCAIKKLESYLHPKDGQ
ncbi:MAG: phosphomethylpyrimidine synthase ThiC [Deltaproteobacteria bacterium]|nr:phosphomethylpyrimidine synthase ThiC [Candidatus Anaeroferrophillus wilburensis]MBN2888428.1 phosphomethylpyrimidine synthase ThiC [Deltaproteobacteria bacterium]